MLDGVKPLVAALACALVAAAGLAAHASGVTPQPNGTIVLSCSGCPQDTSGPVLIGIAVRTGAASTLVGPCDDAVTPTCAAPFQPAFSRDGSRLALIDRFTAVAVAARNGKGYRVLRATRGITAGVPRTFSGVSWSPGGNRLVTSALDGMKLPDGSNRTSIFTVDPRTGAMRRIRASTPATGNFVDPAWSPEGDLIATGSSAERIYLMRSDGTKLRRLGSSVVSGRNPAWSPDGRRVAALDMGGSVWWIARAGGRKHLVVHDPDLDWNAGLAWSPDGRWLVYARTTLSEDTFDSVGHELMLAAVDGSGARRLEVPALPADAYSEIYGFAWSR